MTQLISLHHHHHQYTHHHKQMPLLLPDSTSSKKTFISSLRPFILLSIFSSTLLLLLLLLSIGGRHGEEDSSQSQIPPSSLEALPNSSICCDRTSHRSDVCYMRGDVRTSPSSLSILLAGADVNIPDERIRPYTRKWEPGTMSTIDELRLSILSPSSAAPSCDVRYDVPAVVFSTGGYTGNVYHEFNDGIIPLYTTARQFNGSVVILLLEYHTWWVSKYADVLSRISRFPPLDFSAAGATHCFPSAVVGLRIHGELSLEEATIPDFRRLLDDAYRPRISTLLQQADGFPPQPPKRWKPKLVIMSRNGSRAMENEGEVSAAAEAVGFNVEVLRPRRTTEMAKIYMALNSSDAVVGVHGAAMTHLLFMRPGAALVQIVPLGTDWAAEEYYGGPARRMGLRYTAYKVRPRESSLSRRYRRDDAVLRDPDSVNANGWDVTKRVYLDGQKLRIDIQRFSKRLASVHRYLLAKHTHFSP